MLNSIGELLSRTAASQQARDHHSQALAIARDISATCRKQELWKESAAATSATGNQAKASPACLQQALTIYQRIAAPGARRARETLLNQHDKRAIPTPPSNETPITGSRRSSPNRDERHRTANGNKPPRNPDGFMKSSNSASA